MKNYRLMHLDDVCAEITIDDEFDGSITKVNRIVNPEIMPFRAARSNEDFRQWWKDRSVPETRTALRDLLEERGIRSTGLFLLDNLGLSLSDCYWVKPYESELNWKEINLYENPFQPGLVMKSADSGISTREYSLYSPDASTGGNLPKWWITDKNSNRRFLVKGNDGLTSQQSLNEILATMIHEMQGYENYVSYTIVKLRGGKLGCRCQAFTSENAEFISAWDLVGRRGYAKDEPFRVNFIKACIAGGLSEEEVIRGLDYMNLTDFIISNNDRHLNNFGILRDSHTLRFIKLAPIFDSGNSMMYQNLGQLSVGYSLSEDTHGFHKTYKSMIEHVSNLNLVDISKLPSSDAISALYAKDPIVSPYAKKLADLFASRAGIIHDIQQGRSYYDAVRKYSPKRRKNG